MNPVPDMDGLSCEVKTDERELSGGALPEDEYIPTGGAPTPSGAAREVCLSVSEYGGEDDEDSLNVDLAHGWAVPAFNYWDEEGEAHLMLPVNGRYDGAELAPVEIGGQSPVRKCHALDDLGLAAECVLHFARTGELYPGLRWEEPDPESMYF